MRIPVDRYVADGAVLEDLLGGSSYTVSAGHIDLTGAASLEPHGMRLLRVR
jgi:hypothetical protein